MTIFQITGAVLGGIIVFLFLISYIAMYREWNHIKSGDTGFYTDGSWISGEFKVIHKTENVMVIEYCDRTQETIMKYEYINNDIRDFHWNKK